MARQEQQLTGRRAAKAMKRQEKQVFAFKDTGGVERVLDIEAMRVWAENNLQIESVDIDINKVKDILNNNRIDQKQLLNYTMSAGPKAILVCVDFVDDRSEIVDGNHTYVAMALALAEAAEMGIRMPVSSRIPAYIFEREQWMRFLA